MKIKKIFIFLFSVFLILGAFTAEAQTKRKKRVRRTKIIKPDPPRPEELRPFRESRIKQNNIADKLGLPIIWDNDALLQLKLPLAKRKRFIEIKHRAVPVARSRYYVAKASYTMPWVNSFLENLSKEQYSIFKRKLYFNSFARTIQRQRQMSTEYFYVRTRRGKIKRIRNRAYNPYAAEFDAEHMELLSLHCRLIAFDLSRKNLTISQIEWLRQKFIELKNQDIGIFPIEERTPGNRINCFHIVVFDPVAYRALKDTVSAVP